MESSQHFERAASTQLDSLDRSGGRSRNSLDAAINQVLQGMGQKLPVVAEQAPSKSPTKSPGARSRFALEAVAA